MLNFSIFFIMCFKTRLSDIKNFVSIIADKQFKADMRNNNLGNLIFLYIEICAFYRNFR